MSVAAAESLTEFLRERVGDHLRSVVHYTADDWQVVYLRDDVADRYADGEIERAVDDVRLEGLGKPHQESLYDHGELNCTVKCFENAVEMHFAHDANTGTAVALDAEVFAVHNTFIGRCRELMEV
ncbi:DUF7522 family protein [Halorussus marinus]|uniref:DUF7522 family protein n=1 Tax=Halorussus marinus TaxID=2505976 RepID=UPI00106DFAFA|nr:hypothetical protein [Halorussus marinus]